MDIKSISEKYQLSENEQSVLDYLNQHKGDGSINIRQLAKATYTSPSSIVAMCKKIGFSGYSELLYYIIGAKNLTFTLQDNDVIKEYGEAFRTLIQKYKDSYFMFLSSGLSTNIANYMVDYFNLHGFRATAHSYLEQLRPTYGDKTLLIIVSNSGETKRLAELLEMASFSQIESIAFVGNHDSQIGQKASLTISSETNSAYSYQEFYPQLFFGTSLNTFEFLMSYTLSTWE